MNEWILLSPALYLSQFSNLVTGHADALANPINAIDVIIGQAIIVPFNQVGRISGFIANNGSMKNAIVLVIMIAPCMKATSCLNNLYMGNLLLL